jgi:hypothetical protein
MNCLHHTIYKLFIRNRNRTPALCRYRINAVSRHIFSGKPLRQSLLLYPFLKCVLVARYLFHMTDCSNEIDTLPLGFLDRYQLLLSVTSTTIRTVDTTPQ